jgi:predicted AAA+ superfamily ATPase
MAKWIELPFLEELRKNLSISKPMIQVIVGPRQVGKTTGIRLFLKRFPGPHFYVSADGPIAKHPAWLVEQWNLAKAEAADILFIVDEIQKIEQWSETLKALWDEEAGRKQGLRLIVLGSSSLSIQKGLSESLAGRFQLHKVWPWSYAESEKAYGLSFEQYVIFGGYPGSYPLISSRSKWLSYVKESIVDAVIGKDILSQARVKSPALFRQSFDLICSYPAQEISYTKLLGQLQDRGNVDLVKHYVELFEGAFLVKQLFKFSRRPVLQKSSSPKLLPLCPALYSVTLDADLNAEERGRAFEIVVGMTLARKPGRLFYWRDRQAEVDYVYQYGKRLVGIEVKSNPKKTAKGLLRFKEAFPGSETMVVTPDQYDRVLASL